VRAEGYALAMTKATIVVFDGLRPDLVRPDLTPNLMALARAGCRFPNSRCVFPSETRVNAASLAAGRPPQSHGLVANTFHLAGAFADRAVRTSEMADLVVAEQALGGTLLQGPMLGDRLAAAGRRYATLSTGSSGGSWLLNHRAERHGHLRWSAHGAQWSSPGSRWEEIAARFGPPPAAAKPQSARMRHMTDIYLDYVLPTDDPDIAVLWLAEPDYSFHYAGLASREAREGIAEADRCLGRIVDALGQRPDAADRVVVAVSDHGHVLVDREIDLVAAFSEAGFSADKRAQGEALVGLAPGSPTLATLRRSDPGLLRDLAAWLGEQPWCGLIFTPGTPDAIEGVVPGTFARGLVGVEHARVPDLVFTLADDDRDGAAGLDGTRWNDGPIGQGAGMHGGLHAREMNNLLILAGAGVRAGAVSDLPAGILDVQPTLLHLLGMPSGGCKGRVLSEAFHDGATPVAARRSLSLNLGRRRQTLNLSSVGTARYIDRGTSALG